MEGTAMAVVITRLDLSAADLREAAAPGARREGVAADAGHGLGAGRLVAGGGGRGLRDGAADAARLGASLQRVGAGGPRRPAPAQWPAASPVGRAAGQGG